MTGDELYAMVAAVIRVQSMSNEQVLSFTAKMIANDLLWLRSKGVSDERDFAELIKQVNQELVSKA